MISELVQADGLGSSLIDLLSANLARFVCGGWPLPGPTPLDLKLVRAKECSLSCLEDIVVAASFQCLYRVQLEDDVGDLESILSSVIHLYLEDLRKYNWSSSTFLQLLCERTISQLQESLRRKGNWIAIMGKEAGKQEIKTANSAPPTQAGARNGDIRQRRKLAVVEDSSLLNEFELNP